MVGGVESTGQVQEDEDADESRVKGKEGVIGNLSRAVFVLMFSAEVRLQGTKRELWVR